jgi:putative pyruvate formate lyase activating enzyme
MMLELQARGCHNINFVSPTHFAPQMARSILIAAERGLQLPIVYNTNAYDSVEVLRLLNGIVGVYLPDLKYADSVEGYAYSKVKTTQSTPAPPSRRCTNKRATNSCSAQTDY